MKLLNTVHKRKSATVTTVILILLLLLLFFFGLKYLDPPIESGIAVNFGTSEVGKGDIQPEEPIKSEPINEPEEVVEETVKEDVVEAVTADAENVLTSDAEETIQINKAEEERKAKEAEEAKKAVEQARIQKEQDEKKKKLDALMGGFNSSDGKASGGEGNDDQSGDKGKEQGDPNAKGYYGNGGNGNGGDYQLGNRKPLNKPKPQYECNEEGLVVVTIEVNRNGKVIKATPGTKGSTNTASCLLSRAKEAALETKWEPDPDAGEKQIGIIKYRFSLAN